MSNTRATLRQRVGEALGRRYYVASTTTGTSTVNEIVDAKRTENRLEWDGASIYFTGLTAPNEAVVRGGTDGAAGRLYLDTDLGVGPNSGAFYELVKGYTFNDLNQSLDFAHRDAYPSLYDALDDDTTVTETIGTIKYALNIAWQRVGAVRRQIYGSNPVRFRELQRGVDYELRRAATGIVFECLYDPDVTGLRLHFTGEKIPTLGSGDASTSDLPIEVVVPAALCWLYTKGANPDEASMAQRFDQEAQQQAALSRQAKQDFRMPRQATAARIPRIGTVNDGSTVRGSGF